MLNMYRMGYKYNLHSSDFKSLNCFRTVPLVHSTLFTDNSNLKCNREIKSTNKHFLMFFYKRYFEYLCGCQDTDKK